MQRCRLSANNLRKRYNHLKRKNNTKGFNQIGTQRIYIPPKLIEHNKNIQLSINTITNVQLSINTITFDGVLFFTSISHDIFYSSA